jgi:hypothetical protein
MRLDWLSLNKLLSWWQMDWDYPIGVGLLGLPGGPSTFCEACEISNFIRSRDMRKIHSQRIKVCLAALNLGPL